MKIRLGEKHWLNSDSQCYWISQDIVIEKGNNAGSVVERRVSGYTRTFEEAVDSFIEGHVRGVEINDYNSLVETIETLKRTVESWKVDLVRE